MSRKRFICLDCGEDTGKLHEHYFLNNAVWDLIHDSVNGMLCIGCAEIRLGRTLQPSDFTVAYINNPKFAPMSNRLLNRLGYA